MTMKEDVNWSLILKFNEIYDYLDSSNLINVSLLNKQLRLKLKCIVLSNFNITSLTKIQALSNNISDTNIDNSLLMQTRFIKSAGFSTQLGLQSFQLTSQYLNNLTNLKLSKMDIQLPVINDFLKKFKNLKQLELTKVHIIIEYGVVDYNKDLKVSNQLENLILDNCTWIGYDSDNTSSFIWSREGDQGPYVCLSNQLYPKLKYLKIIELNTREDNLINNFLINNNNSIKVIEVKLNELNSYSFELIKKLNNLKELRIWNSNILNDDIQFEPLINIKSLKILNIKETSNLDSITNICLNCPNLECLEIGYYNQFIEIYSNLLNNLKILKSLTLINIKTGQNSNLIKELKSLSIEELKLINFNPTTVNLNQFNNFKKLKRVSIESKEDFSHNRENINNYLDNTDGNNWTNINFNESLNFYKN